MAPVLAQGLGGRLGPDLARFSSVVAAEGRGRLIQVPGGRVIGWVEDPDGVVQEAICPAPALNAIFKRS